MEVTKLVINGIDITTLDKPIGLEVNKLSLDRDFQYSCIDTTIEAELRFYCSSGKTELDAEFESKGVEGSGYIEITDSCGTNGKTYTFNLDFKKYNNQGDFTTIGLIDVNSLWKQDLNKEVTVVSGLSSDFYVRNLQLTYDYASENVYSTLQTDTLNTDLQIIGNIVSYNTAPPTVVPPAPTLPSSFYNPTRSVYVMPRVNETINEFEESDGLKADYIITSGWKNMLCDENSVLNVETKKVIRYPLAEPTELFWNKNVDGEFTISTENTRTQIDISPVGTIEGDFYRISEVIVIGDNFAEPRIIKKNVLYDTPSTIPTGGTYSSSYSKSYSLSKTVKESERVWIYYECEFREKVLSVVYNAPNWDYTKELAIYFEFMQFELLNEITANFTIKENTISVLTNAADIVPYHTKTKAYKGENLLNNVFNTAENICNTDCYSDLWFSRGDYIRNKVNAASFIVKPTDFFRELEKVVCCGLGYFYDTNPSGVLKLLTVYDFYTDTLVPSQYQFDYNDLIDGKIELSPFTPPYYKDIQIGYSNFKDSPKDYCKLNEYSIDNVSESNYSKVSDFIASQYVITKALRLGTEDKDLEFDNNIFLFSGGSVVSGATTYNATLSQTSSFLEDNIFTTPLNTAGINRRYATALNLFRHLYKWGFSLFAGKTELLAKKYEGNTIYDYEIRDTTGTSNDPFYQGLSDCKLPLDNYVKVDRTISDIYTDFFQSGLHVPTQITFKTANLSSLDLIAMRAHQYDLFSVTDGVNTYYGNLISANLEDDITEIKLLRRFKNGI